MTELRAAIAAAEARVVELRAENEAARERLTPENRRRRVRARVRNMTLAALAIGFGAGHVEESGRQAEAARVEAVLHHERMYSKHYEGESCEASRADLGRALARCSEEVDR